MKSFLTSPLTRVLLLCAGLALVLFLLARIGVRAAITEASRIGWMFALVVLLGALPHLLRTLSWRRLLRLGESGPGFPRMFAWWLAGEAISHLSFSWSGEAYRVVVARQQIPLGPGTAAMALNRVVYTLASLLVAVVGVGWALVRLPLPAGLEIGIRRFLMGAVALLVVVLGVLLFRRLAGRREGRATARPPAVAAEGEWRLRHTLRQLHQDWGKMSLRGPGDITYLVILNLLTALVGVAEVWVILYALGAPVSAADALFIEGFLKLLSGLAYFVPGNIGVAEGGIVLILGFLRVSAATGLALAMIRRARALAWVGIGCLVLLGLGTGFRVPAEKEIVASPPK